MAAKLDDQSRGWAAQIVDNALEKGEVNFVHEVAYQLPMNMIADIVGIPPTDRDQLFDMVDTMLYSIDPETFLSQEERDAVQGKLLMYGRELGERKRREPADDIWTKLTTVEVEQPDGSKTSLSELELDLFFLVLTVAGSETTRNTISSGMIAQDVVLHGAEIKAGEPVTLRYPSANHDAGVFADPFTFDITRTPNPHVAFGGAGVHHCLGANLARCEITMMFEELLARVDTIEMLGDPAYSVAGFQSPVSFSLKDLPVRPTLR